MRAMGYNRTSNQNKQLILLIAGFVFLSSLIGIGIYTYTSNQKGELYVVSVPDTTVFIDNVPQNKTPFKTSLKPGSYQLKLVPNGEEASISASFEQSVTILPNILTYINRVLGTNDITSSGYTSWVTKMKTRSEQAGTGELMVKSDPQGALVYLDSDEQGVTPITLKNISRGDHELSVYLPNFVRYNVRPKISEGFTTNIDVKLSVDEQAVQSSEKATVEASVISSSSVSKRSSESSTKSSAKSSAKASSSSVKTSTKSSLLSGKVIFSIEVKNTPTGFLRVREDATAASEELGKLNPKDKVDVYEEVKGWYKINFEGKSGWISAQYTTKL